MTRLFKDNEATAPVRDPGKRKTKTGYFWALARNDQQWGRDDPPGVAFTYAPGRFGQYAEDILKGSPGTLQVDGYAGYNRPLKRHGNTIRPAFCWVHAWRKLFEDAKSSCETACKIAPPVFVNICTESAEERAGVIDGKCIEDLTVGIG